MRHFIGFDVALVDVSSAKTNWRVLVFNQEQTDLIELRRTLQEDEDFVLGLQVGHQSRRLLCSPADGPTVPLVHPLFGWLFDRFPFIDVYQSGYPPRIS
jgi:hypothetical protein